MSHDNTATTELVAEADDWSDDDSALGNSVASSSISLSSSILKYRKENGRTYHAYKEGKYALPNDEGENDRLDHMHHLTSLTFNGQLFLCPIFEKKKQVHRVLDAGTGTGIWALDFADEHPESEVLGIDLSPIQPTFVAPNCTFQIDDLEAPWSYTQKFDFIFARYLTGSLSDWPRFFKQSFDNLTDGGYIEICDPIHPFLSDDDSIPPGSALQRLGENILKGHASVGQPLDSALKYKDQLSAAGFVNIVEKNFKWPINTWPKDKKAKELGLWARENIVPALFGLTNVAIGRWLGWSKEELELFLVDVRKDFLNTKIHAYFPLKVVYAQKPDNSKV